MKTKLSHLSVQLAELSALLCLFANLSSATSLDSQQLAFLTLIDNYRAQNGAGPLQVSIAFMTTTGFCAGQDGGQVYNLTETKFFFPRAHSAASLYRRMDGVNQFVTTLQSGGDPANNAAIGDFIEGTIIRASALTS